MSKYSSNKKILNHRSVATRLWRLGIEGHSDMSKLASQKYMTVVKRHERFGFGSD